MRQFLKRRAERMLSSSVVGRVTRHRVRAKRLVLAYHGVIPEGGTAAGERALFIRQRDFAAHLDVLREVADIAPLDEIDAAGDGRPRVAITFDDAYRGAVDAGVSELVARELPATIFVAPARLNDHVFWWDALAHNGGDPSSKVRDFAIDQLGGVDERVRAWAGQSSIPATDDLPSFAKSATLEELSAAVTHPGITVGSHSWSHPNLAALGTEELVFEVTRSRDWLRANFGEKAVPWLAYPYGIDSVGARLVLADASYRGALRIVGGWHAAEDFSPFSRPRLNIPAGLSAEGLRSRLVGAVLA